MDVPILLGKPSMSLLEAQFISSNENKTMDWSLVMTRIMTNEKETPVVTVTKTPDDYDYGKDEDEHTRLQLQSWFEFIKTNPEISPIVEKIDSSSCDYNVFDGTFEAFLKRPEAALLLDYIQWSTTTTAIKEQERKKKTNASRGSPH